MDGTARASGLGRRLEISRGPSTSEGNYGNAQFRHRADAVRETLPGRGCGAYRAPHGRQGVESGGCGCTDSGARVRGILFERRRRETAPVLGDLFAARLEGAEIFMVDDLDAAFIP